MAERKHKTIDGERTAVSELNLETPFESASRSKGFMAKLVTVYKNLSLVMAGMYTGLNCYGTPHSHRATDEDGDKPDNRPI
ncbi:MAG: hypothetical protein OXU66_12035 [Gammaproteobacteria bacterium]|nr:hypothetical protein [Gammaproteobacteria bacterium]MDD9896470.1 hypothetical protein [Gammaproteobacteria bacterium]MDD9959652.1 hypothetical protein [Gammaproteobacteria bacterium]